jgi:hypothetical protein
MKNKLQHIIDEGKNNVGQTLRDIQNEFQIRKDFIVKPSSIEYNVNGGLSAQIGGLKQRFTDHARTQLFGHIGMPPKFYDKLASDDAMKDLASLNLNRLTAQYAQDGLMFRTVADTTKGVLSPSYGRYDASPLFEAYVDTCLLAGYVPMRGKNTDYRYQITFILPEMYEIAPGEYVVFSITFTTSDYGTGANSITLGVLRIICANLAQGFNLFRKVHIGSRFQGAEAFVQMSETTHQLDVRTIASAIRDIVRKSLELVPEIQTKLEVIANDRDFNVNTALASIQKRYGKEIADNTKSLYETAGISELPEVPGAWRFSNTLSLLAKNQKPDMQIDLEREAFSVLKIAA